MNDCAVTAAAAAAAAAETCIHGRTTEDKNKKFPNVNFECQSSTDSAGAGACVYV